MGVRGFDLLDIAVARNIPAAMLATYPPNPDALKRSIEMGARGYLLKVKLEEIVPLIEDVLTSEYLPGWKRVLQRMKEQGENRPISWDTLPRKKTEKKKSPGTEGSEE
jgi:DNA-binding NarL/FixJ family response regulator